MMVIYKLFNILDLIIFFNNSSFNISVCTSLIQNSERYEEENGGSRIRIDVLTQLCAMYPPAALVIRAKCVRNCLISN